ncbi:plexin-B2-like, partial [Plectropomus leopardus]|uniref:plexin-B2-like n=1 Tax=Plectropomus leopardus TaxID=160734 RepID=UPI001C4BB11F
NQTSFFSLYLIFCVFQVRDNATLVLSRVLHTQSFHQHQDSYEEKNALLEDDNTFHLVRPADEIDEVKSKRGSMKDKAMTKAITEIYLTRLLSVKVRRRGAPRGDPVCTPSATARQNVRCLQRSSVCRDRGV